MGFDFDLFSFQERITYTLRALYLAHGFRQYRMSKFEEYDFYGRYKDFLTSDNIITFSDNGRLMALKPDVTLSIIKSLRDEPGALQKLCYNENVYRVSRGSDSFTEIMQAGLECIGEIDAACVSEVLGLAAESLALCHGDYVLEVSHLGILSAFLDALGCDGVTRRDVLKCAGEKNLHGITEVCRKADVPEERAEPLRRLLGLCGAPEDVLPPLRSLCADMELSAELDALNSALSGFAGSDAAAHIQLDFSAVSNTNYYNGIIFRGFLRGIPERVLSGGQYDRLMRKMHRSAGGVGFAVYLDALERLEDIADA